MWTVDGKRLCAFVVCMVAVGVAVGQTQWTDSGADDWFDATNWEGIVPNSPNAEAVLGPG